MLIAKKKYTNVKRANFLNLIERLLFDNNTHHDYNQCQYQNRHCM